MKKKSLIPHPSDCSAPCQFTLIELLVVVSIIAILAAMLLPALNKARLSAQTTQCLSNLKQTMLTGGNYAEDHYGMLPHPRLDNGYAYVFRREGYSKDPNYKGNICPSFKPIYSSNHVYGLNNKPGYTSSDSNDYRASDLLKLPEPSRQWIFMDSLSSGWWGELRQSYSINNTYASSFNAHFRHNNRAETTFADGHASGHTIAEILKTKTVLWDWYDGYQIKRKRY